MPDRPEFASTAVIAAAPVAVSAHPTVAGIGGASSTTTSQARVAARPLPAPVISTRRVAADRFAHTMASPISITGRDGGEHQYADARVDGLHSGRMRMATATATTPPAIR